jgi:hypothetical protein
MHGIFFDLGILFLDLYVSFGPGRFFLWALGAQKLWGTCLCVFWSLFFFWVDLHGSLPSPFFFDNYDLGFFFWSCAPASWTLPPKGGNSIVIGANIGLDVFRPWHLFFGTCTCFLDLAQGGRNGDMET